MVLFTPTVLLHIVTPFGRIPSLDAIFVPGICLLGTSFSGL